MVAVFGALLYIPLAGAFGLWDPWETHYSEVSREILSRDDWITTWWAQEGWFMSKPILIFWMSALGMGAGSALGLQVGADAGPSFQEWFIRLPIIALTIAALVALARAVARAWGPRAGLLSALVLATMPQWFFLSHQAMTDMPFVAPLVIAIAMFTLAVTADPRALATPRALRLGRFTLRVALAPHRGPRAAARAAADRVPAHAHAGDLVSRRRQRRPVRAHARAEPPRPGADPHRALLVGQRGQLRRHAGDLGAGLARVGASGEPHPVLPLGAAGGRVDDRAALGARRAAPRATRAGLYYALFYVWCGVSTMGKGPGGLAIPGAVAGLHFVSTRRWRELLRDPPRPRHRWCSASWGCPGTWPSYGRLGDEFIQRFVVHDIINRTVLGVHGDTGSLRYFLWQLGYAMFPWTGLVPVALLAGRVVIPADATQAQRDVARIGILWFLLAFALFSAMTTKFHHYIFPAIPGAAVMVGLLVHRLMGASHEVTTDGLFERLRPQIAQAGALVLAVVGGASFLGGVRGQTALNATRTNAPALGVAMLVAAAAAWWFGWRIHTSQTAQSAPVEAPPTDQVEANNYRENKLSAETSGAPSGARTAMISSGSPPRARRRGHSGARGDATSSSRGARLRAPSG